ncbi:hypothetical protein [Ottowia sp.]|uniref:hypothetical protein n=1 Tax=Ottowia sp. TaxID=1898956 RepID=UPI0025F2FA51|nr:hypothetical protein [Ottowia sp.]MBK6616344.1 hypothetical protein [Ottowia sp.]
MDKKKLAVLAALEAAPAGLLKADFREATSREVSAHTVQEEQLDPLLSSGHIAATAEASTDGRIKGMVDRFTLTDAGKAALAQCRAGAL